MIPKNRGTSVLNKITRSKTGLLDSLRQVFFMMATFLKHALLSWMGNMVYFEIDVFTLMFRIIDFTLPIRLRLQYRRGWGWGGGEG